jgi:integrase
VKGSTYKRCKCPSVFDETGRRVNCPKRHGSWYFIAELDNGPGGKRRYLKKGGFGTQRDAAAALGKVLEQVRSGAHTDDARATVGAYLEAWLDDKVAAGLRPTTARSYRHHVEQYLTPPLGHLRLGDLRSQHVERMLRALVEGNADRARPLGPASVRRVHATLRSALSTAKRRRLISHNPAVDVELPKASRPKVRPWEPEELGAFLDHAAGDRLGPMFELIAMTGLRRGEACGLRWVDVDLERGCLWVRQQIVQLGHETVIGPPKTASGEDRRVDLDEQTMGTLLAHRLAQDAERAAWGEAWAGSGLVFTREDGSAWHPETVTKRFRDLTIEAGLRPVRLHDLRHGQASLMLAAGVPLAVVSKRLGHSSITITSDTYSHLLEGVGRQAAEAASGLVPRAPRPDPARERDHSATTPPLDVTQRVPLEEKRAGHRSAPRGT